MKWFWIVSIVLALSACNQYRCYDGTYVEDAYNCFNHGGLSYYKAYLPRAISKPSTSATALNVAGTWDVHAKRTSGSCLGVPSSIKQPVVLSQNGNSVTTSIPGIGRYRGRLSGKNVKTSGKDVSLCSITFNSDMNFQSASSLTVTGSVQALCFGGYRCSMNFSGTAKKRAATNRRRR